MTLVVAGHCSCGAAIVVTASGGGDQVCAMAAWICWNFRKPRPATSTASAETTRIIRFFITSSLSPCSVDVDAAFFDQGPGGARHLGASHPVVCKSRDLIEPGSGQIILARQHQEVRGEPGLVPVLLGRELNFG